MQFVITVYDGAGMLAKRMEVRNSAIRADPCSSCLRPPTAWIPSSWPYSSSVEVSAPSVPVLAGAWQDGRVSVSSVAFRFGNPLAFCLRAAIYETTEWEGIDLKGIVFTTIQDVPVLLDMQRKTFRPLVIIIWLYYEWDVEPVARMP